MRVLTASRRSIVLSIVGALLVGACTPRPRTEELLVGSIALRVRIGADSSEVLRAWPSAKFVPDIGWYVERPVPRVRSLLFRTRPEGGGTSRPDARVRAAIVGFEPSLDADSAIRAMEESLGTRTALGCGTPVTDVRFRVWLWESPQLHIVAALHEAKDATGTRPTTLQVHFGSASTPLEELTIAFGELSNERCS